MCAAYYNENNAYAARWLRNLIDAGYLPSGDVDDRDIRDVQPSELAGYVQCHFFAGIGGWPFAARCAGWPDDRPIWTGSCPCQPFSIAGRRRGTTDHRHLWPDFHRLISACRPPVIMGEQVAGPAGEAWVSRVRADLESEAFAFRAVDVTAYAIGAPHERQRLYWLAERLEHAAGIGRREGWPEQQGRQREPASVGTAASCGMGNAMREGRPIGEAFTGSAGPEDGGCERHPAQRSDDAGFWSDAEDIWCEWDQKIRRAQPGTPMLVDGLPGRVSAFAAFGNAIVVPLAQEVIAAYLDCRP